MPFPPLIASAVRVPTGRFLGALKDVPATELGTLAVAEAVRRAGVEPALVDECVMGNVVSAGLGQNPARQAALGAGLPPHASALAVNMVCGSGLRAVMLAAQAVAAGDAGIVVAGGMESMSNAPFLVPGARTGLRLGHARLVDAVLHDGLWCAFENRHMGALAESVAREHGVTRAMQDEYAAESHRRAAVATTEGWFSDEIIPVRAPQTRGEPVTVDRDETIRPDTTTGVLGGLAPAFEPGGTVTAGNAPGLSDGAAALVVMAPSRAESLGITPLARIVAQATSGLEPRLVLMTPVDAVRRVAAKAGWPLGSVDLFEINEAFSAQMVAVIRALDIDPERVNAHGGAVALGHPIGASGARVLTTLVYALRRRGLRRGIASLCLGGGNGVAIAVERG